MVFSHNSYLHDIPSHLVPQRGVRACGAPSLPDITTWPPATTPYHIPPPHPHPSPPPPPPPTPPPLFTQPGPSYITQRYISSTSRRQAPRKMQFGRPEVTRCSTGGQVKGVGGGGWGGEEGGADSSGGMTFSSVAGVVRFKLIFNHFIKNKHM